MRLLPAALWLAVISTTASCSDAAISQAEDMQEAVAMNFTTQCADSASSRGVETSAHNFQQFAVSARITNAAGAQTYFAHETYNVSYVGQSVTATQQGKVHYWLGQDYAYSFYAYTPSDAITFSPGVIDKFQIAVAQDAYLQDDILVANVDNAPYGQKVPLKFTHPMAEISFSVGISSLDFIRTITLTGIVGKGIFNIDTGEWSYRLADTSVFLLNVYDLTQSYSSLSGDDLRMFMIPQTLTTRSKLIIDYVDFYGVEHVHQHALTGTWLPGHRYNYTINLTR